jgi:hypothetical protein
MSTDPRPMAAPEEVFPRLARPGAALPRSGWMATTGLPVAATVGVLVFIVMIWLRIGAGAAELRLPYVEKTAVFGSAARDGKVCYAAFTIPGEGGFFVTCPRFALALAPGQTFTVYYCRENHGIRWHPGFTAEDMEAKAPAGIGALVAMVVAVVVWSAHCALVAGARARRRWSDVGWLLLALAVLGPLAPLAWVVIFQARRGNPARGGFFAVGRIAAMDGAETA